MLPFFDPRDPETGRNLFASSNNSIVLVAALHEPQQDGYAIVMLLPPDSVGGCTQGAHKLVMAFRGTKGKSNVLTDLNTQTVLYQQQNGSDYDPSFGPLRAHAGFVKLFRSDRWQLVSGALHHMRCTQQSSIQQHSWEGTVGEALIWVLRESIQRVGGPLQMTFTGHR